MVRSEHMNCIVHIRMEYGTRASVPVTSNQGGSSVLLPICSRFSLGIMLALHAG